MEDRTEAMEPDEMNDDAQAAFNFCGSARDVMHRYTHCAVCDGNLHFTYMTDFGKSLTQETARCPECAVKVRRLTHRLQ